MTTFLKAALQSIITENTELAEVNLHKYLVDKTKQLSEKKTTPGGRGDRSGWCIVFELNDKLCLGPYQTYAMASQALKNRELPTYAAPRDKIVFIGNGSVDADDKFTEFKSD